MKRIKRLARVLVLVLWLSLGLDKEVINKLYDELVPNRPSAR